jgi:hypothetical protein
MTPGQRFYLTLRPVAGHDGEPTVRLRGALKTLLRTFGFRCTRLTVKDDDPAVDASTDAPQPQIAVMLPPAKPDPVEELLREHDREQRALLDQLDRERDQEAEALMKQLDSLDGANDTK